MEIVIAKVIVIAMRASGNFRVMKLWFLGAVGAWQIDNKLQRNYSYFP